MSNAAVDAREASENVSKTPGTTVKNRRLSLRFRRIMAYFLIAVVLYIAFVWVVQRTILFPGRLIPTSLHAEPATGVEVIHLEPSDLLGGKVEAWFIPGRGTGAGSPGPAVIYAHGNGELIDLWQHDLTAYADLGVSVMLVEYRGYGRSAGASTQDGITRDFIAFFDLLAARPDVDPGRIVFHGRSLGGGALAALAQHRTPAALILESTFTGVPAMAKRFLVPPFLVRDKFDTIGTLRAYAGPSLILHGELDEVIPVEHARRNAAAAKHATLVIYEDMRHNTPAPEKEYWADIEAFLREAGILR